jgi:hypothetical protein
MAEDPEQVLPQQGVGAGGHVEELGTEQPLKTEEEQRHGDDRHREQEQELHHQHHPREHRHLHEAHARRAHVQDGHDEVDGAGQRRDAGDLQGEQPEVDAVGGREDRPGVRRVAEPAAVGCPAEEPAEVQEDAGRDECPQTERVEPGEGDVAGADLQRHEVVAEGGRHGHHEEEDHRGGVHGEHLVVRLRAQHVSVRPSELQADQQRLDPAHHEKDQGDGAVHDADLLVIDGEDPVLPTGDADRPAEQASRLTGRDETTRSGG